MNVLVDTSVWSLALRRARRIDDAVPRELAQLIQEDRVVLIGPVRQELLSGIKSKPQFDQLREICARSRISNSSLRTTRTPPRRTTAGS